MKFILEEERLEVLRDAPWRTGNVFCDPTDSIFPTPAEPVQGPLEGSTFYLDS